MSGSKTKRQRQMGNCKETVKENQLLRIVVSAFLSSLHAINLICNYHSKQDLRKDLKEGNAITLQVLQSSSKVWSVMGGSIEVVHWEFNKGIMKNNLQTNCKLATQYQVRIIMRVVHGTNVNWLFFDIPKKEVEARREITHSEQQRFDKVLCLSRPEDKILD